MQQQLLQIMSIKDIQQYKSVLNDSILQIIPELQAAVDFPGGPYHNETVFEHLIWASEWVSPKFPLLRFTALLHDIGKPHVWNGQNFRHHDDKGAEIAGQVMQRLGGFSETEQNFVTGAIQFHMIAKIEDMSVKTIGSKFRQMQEKGVEYRDFLRLRYADRHGTRNWQTKYNNMRSYSFLRNCVKKIREALKPVEVVSTNPLAVSGNDVMKILDIQPGPKVGEVMRYLIANFPHNDREILLRAIADYPNVQQSLRP